MSNAITLGVGQSTRQRNDSRFRQLLALAREGNQDAVGDLYREYGVEYGSPSTGSGLEDEA